MRLLPACVAFLITAAPILWGGPSTEEIVAKAREYLGGDAALGDLTSIYYEGEFVTAEGDLGKIRIFFQKPAQQRVEIVRGEIGEVTALNDFDGWRKVYDVNNPSRSNVNFLSAQAIRELQANTAENLNFFRGIERRRGSIENEGVVEVDGRETVKLVFRYPRNIAFTRFFDVETGRLMLTRTHEGMEIREQGEIRVEGILFPESLEMQSNGKTLNQVFFSEIRLNERFDDSLFEVPGFGR